MLAWEAEMFRDSDHRPLRGQAGHPPGLWQVSGRSRLSYRQQLELDVEALSAAARSPWISASWPAPFPPSSEMARCEGRP